MMSNRNLEKHVCVMLKTFHQRKVYFTAVNCYFTQIEVRHAFCNLFEIEHTEFFNSSIFYVPFTIVKDAGNCSVANIRAWTLDLVFCKTPSNTGADM